METKAAAREASWSVSPDARRPKKYHIIKGACAPACGLPCLLNLELQMKASKVPIALRCQRNGCRGRWPKER